MSETLRLLKPRNDFVVLKVVERGKLGGIHIPGTSTEGNLYFVHEVGPNVEDLAIGDQVIPTGQPNVDYAPIPGHQGLIIIKEANVVLKYVEIVEERVVDGMSDR